MFNTKRIEKLKYRQCESKSETFDTITHILCHELVDETIFHDIHHSLLYKYHLFNINACSFDLDYLNCILNKSLPLRKYNTTHKTTYKDYYLYPPSDAIQISFSTLPDVTFHIFHISNHPQFKQYLLHNIQHDLDLKILQNILKLSIYYHNIPNTKLSCIIRNYLLSEYHPLLTNNKSKILTNAALLHDIIHCNDEDIINLIIKCKQKQRMILSGTVGLSEPPTEFEWIAIALNKEWIEMTVTVFPDRYWNNSDDIKHNKYQFHMFITRNFQFNIHQWLHGQSTTPKLSLWLHTSCKVALNAQHIVSRPIGRMKSIMKSVGFSVIERDKIDEVINTIGQRNYECFNQVQAVNDWTISPKTFEFFPTETLK